jgi:Beta-fructosidases (levanase/invertase)
MPRLLTVEDDHLRQDPLPEMAMLRGAHQSFQNIDVAPDRSGYVKAKGDALEIVAEFENRGASLFGLKVRLSKDGKTFVRVFFDTKTNEYGVDGNLFARSLHDEPWLNPKRGVGPSYLQIGKPVVMRIFLDKILIEAFVNGQTCTTSLEDVNPLNDGMDLFSEGGMVVCRKLDIWEMKSSF